MSINIAWTIAGFVWIFAAFIAAFANDHILMGADMICGQIAFATAAIIGNKNNR